MILRNQAGGINHPSWLMRIGIDILRIYRQGDLNPPNIGYARGKIPGRDWIPETVKVAENRNI
jgi:hypothetical protein